MYLMDAIDVLQENICSLEKTEEFRHVHKKVCVKGTAFTCSPNQMTQCREIIKYCNMSVLLKSQQCYM